MSEVIRVDEPYGHCTQASGEDHGPVVPLASAFAMDASGYHAALATLPTFGCNRWEAKP